MEKFDSQTVFFGIFIDGTLFGCDSDRELNFFFDLDLFALVIAIWILTHFRFVLYNNVVDRIVRQTYCLENSL